MSDSNRIKSADNAELEAVTELLKLIVEDRAESAATPVIVSTFRGHGMHLLLDVLLTDTWDMALIKVALATAEKRSDFTFDTELMRRFGTSGWVTNRDRCRHYARRLHGDEDGLDMMWLMLAANPAQPWTFGFMHRLTAAVVEVPDQVSAAEQRLLDAMFSRFEKWQHVRDGFPTKCEDPFKAVTHREWNRALEQYGEKVVRDAEAAAGAASSQKAALARLREHVVTDDVQDGAQETAVGVTVIAGEPKLLAPYKALTACQTVLTMVPQLVPIRNVLRAEFPHCHDAIDTMLVDLRSCEVMAFRPFVLVGEPGSGKSRLIRRLAELLGAKLRRYDAAGSSDNSFGGTPKRWSTALACFPLTAIGENKVANPIVLVDEIDKAGMGYSSGNLAQALMPFLERETAASYPDPGLEVEANLSHVCYAMTANDDSKLPSPLKDRLRVIRVPSPGVAQLELLCVSILKDLAVELNVPAAFLTALAPDELAVIARAWGDNGSVRRLQKIVRGTVTARDTSASRH